jgi:hypothetical protein
LQTTTGGAVGLCQNQRDLVARGHEMGQRLLGELGGAGED